MFTLKKNINDALDEICEDYNKINIDMHKFICHKLFLTRLNIFLSKLIRKRYFGKERLYHKLSYCTGDMIDLLCIDGLYATTSRTNISVASIKIMNKKCKALKSLIDILLDK